MSGDTLLAQHVGTPWQVGENVAACLNGSSHRCPAESCGCGFWAYNGLGQLARERHCGGHYALGLVKGYGRVLIGTKGFRCEKAALVGLVDTSSRIASHYRTKSLSYQDVVDKITKQGRLY